MPSLTMTDPPGVTPRPTVLPAAPVCAVQSLAPVDVEYATTMLLEYSTAPETNNVLPSGLSFASGRVMWAPLSLVCQITAPVLELNASVPPLTVPTSLGSPVAYSVAALADSARASPPTASVHNGLPVRAL